MQGDLAGLRLLAFHFTAAGELRDGDGLQVGGPVLQPPGRGKRAGQLVIGKGREVRHRLLGQRAQDRAR